MCGTSFRRSRGTGVGPANQARFTGTNRKDAIEATPDLLKLSPRLNGI
jgi:hypothetical protein